MQAAEMLRVSDCVGDGVRIAIPQPTEWQRIGNEIEAYLLADLAQVISVNCAEVVRMIQ